jgi:hypothetical protein
VQVRCSCGAYPPEDARFCHKCARPLSDEDHVLLTTLAAEAVAPVVTTSAVEPPPLPQVVASAINFRNPRAVTVSIMVAVLTLLLLFSLATVAPASVPFVFCAGGFLATIVYTRRTGESISAQSGARMGFMTCLWAFVVILLMSCLLVAMLASPEARQAIQQQSSTAFQGNPQMADAMAKTLKSLDNPSAFIMNLLFGILFMFCMWSLLSMLGGIIAAKLARRQ